MRAKKLLYAEDNPDDLFIFSMALKRAALPHQLHAVEDGENAIDWLRGEGEYANREKHPLPDVLILDLKMPRKTGFDVLEWLRDSGQFPHLPVVILSSSDDPRDIKRAQELGVAGYFTKSASCQDVIGYLASLS
jgi:CheY-like chemotaxis protein